MFLRVTIEFHVVLPETTTEAEKASVRPVSPSRSDAIKAGFNAALENAGGFQNWQEKQRECLVAEQMLNDPDSILESLDGESRYLLSGSYDGDDLYVFIDWQRGKQPCILKVERRQLHRRVK